MCKRSSGRTGGALAVAFTALALSALALGAATAFADSSVCSTGTGAGQCVQPQGVAVDTETGRIYVGDYRNNRVDVFQASSSSEVSFVFAFGWGVADGVSNELQTCTLTCFVGIKGSGAGQFDGISGIAVDNQGGSSSRHDVYVIEAGNPNVPGNARVQKFDDTGKLLVTIGAGELSSAKEGSTVYVDVGPSGDVYVIDASPIGPSESEGEKVTFRKYDASGALLLTKRLLEGKFIPKSLAVTSDGSFYVSYAVTESLVGYDTNGNQVKECNNGIPTPALAVDGSDDLYAQQRLGSGLTITEYAPDCTTVLRRFGYGVLTTRGNGLALFSSGAGDLLVAEEQGVQYLGFPVPGPVLAPLTVEEVGNSRARLRVPVNPEGEASEYQVEYVDRKNFETEGGYASSKTRTTGFVPVGTNDFELHNVSVMVGCADPTNPAEAANCLIPETEYVFRAKARNGSGEGNSPKEGPGFVTKPPVEIVAAWSSEVGTDSARLSTKVNPSGISASGYFEYVDDAKFQENGFAGAVKTPDTGGGETAIPLGAGSVAVTRSVTLALAEGTVYHYRFVVTDALIAPREVRSEEHVVRVFQREGQVACAANEEFRTGLSASLPDCRAYEMVSPLEKDGSDVVVLREAGTFVPATLDQSATDGSRMAYGSYHPFGDAPSAPVTSQYIASRGAGEWVSHSILAPREHINISTLDSFYSEVKLFSADLCQSWFRTAAEPQLTAGAIAKEPNLYRRVDNECGGPSYEAITTVQPSDRMAGMELVGADETGAAAVYQVYGNLPKTGAPTVSGERLAVYWRAAGETSPTRFVCMLPDGTAWGGSCTVGTGHHDNGQGRAGTNYRAVSADAQRVFWTAAHHGPGKLYLRENAGQTQSAVSGGKCTQPIKACTIAVSEKGEQLSGAKESRFWVASADGSKVFFSVENDEKGVSDLYEFDVDSGATTLIAHKVGGVMGASEDASYLYLDSKEALSGANPQGGAPVTGKDNLYLFHEGTFRFIATLVTSTDVMSGFSAVRPEPVSRTSRVTPDGSHAVFMSTGSLTGYDNTDVASGQADSEVYVYDATANSGGGGLVCVSCNPSGERPAGTFIDPGAAISEGQDSIWAAGRLPVWQSSLYPGRVFADNGARLFFETIDSLSARDSNGRQDVYQWEMAGTGGCAENHPDFSASNDGCVDLISSGQGVDDATFADATPSGEDVFFTTASSLVSQDYGLVDLYDARVNGGFPAAPPRSAGCEGEACQSPPVAPLDATPGSLTFSGPGDVSEGASARVKPKAGGLSRAQQLARALHACASKPKPKRAACRVRARKRYGPKAKKTTIKLRASRSGKTTGGRGVGR
jgi:hypothetical protein